MDDQGKKLILQIYGFIRMVFGVGQLVGLMAAFFLLEFILKYPSQHKQAYLIDAEITALIYLCVIFRSIFHITTGIGMVKRASWTKLWIYGGWPVMFVMSIGLAFIFYEQWHAENYASNIFDALSFFKLICYLGLISFDVFFIAPAVRPPTLSNEEKTSEDGVIYIVLFSAVLFFVILLFLGQPVKQGFHPGYYKVKGKIVKEEVKKEIIKKPRPAALPSEKEEVDPKFIKEFKPQEQEDSVPVQAVSIKQGSAEQESLNIQKIEKSLIQTGIAYTTIIGWMGGAFIIIGLLLKLYAQLYLAVYADKLEMMFLAFGFLLWLIYGIAIKLPVLIVTSVAAMILAVAAVILYYHEG